MGVNILSHARHTHVQAGRRRTLRTRSDLLMRVWVSMRVRVRVRAYLEGEKRLVDFCAFHAPLPVVALSNLEGVRVRVRVRVIG